MKKLTTSLLLGLLVLTLSGCGNNSTTNTDITPTTGAVTNVSSGSNTADGTTKPLATPTVLPTPTPEGNYVGFSVDSGFYENAQDVTLSCNVEGALIYYTLDGSTPNKTSTLYQNPIKVTRKLYTENVLSAQTGTSASNFYLPDFSVDKGTVIRAIAYLPDGTTTPVAHATYFIDLDRAQYGDVPVISLITDFENLYDYETGIYVLGKSYDEWLAEDPSREYLEGWQKHGNYSNRGDEWERPISVELITADGTAGFKQNMGVRIMGGASRNQAQKSLKLIAREEYGQKNLKYELIPGNYNSDGELIAKYKSFVLRVGGNDADFGRLRDPYLQTLVSDARFMTQQSTPCVVFLNGEYWGMYTITEDYTDNHIENNYGVDNKNVILVKRGEIEEGEEEDLSLFRDMYLFITQNDMSNPEFYKAACELVDMGSFLDYFAFELYIHNKDSIFENNNWRMWRVRETDMATPYSDGKWRFAAYDNDFSTGIYDGAGAASADNISAIIKQSSDSERRDNIENYVPIELFRSLLNNEEFRSELILALCDMRNIYFEPKLAKTVLDEMSGPYLTLMPDTFKRFGPDWIAYGDPASYYEGKIKDLSKYMSSRYVAIPNMLRKVFDLSSPSKLTISTDDASMGFVEINNRPVNLTSDFGGMYFAETTVTVTAVPAEGYKFVGWESKSDLITDATSETLKFSVSAPVTIKAVFEKK